MLSVEYYTIEGQLIQRFIDMDRGVTVEDIDYMAMQYFEKTGRIPEAIFIDLESMSKIQKSMASNMRYSNPASSGVAAYTISAFHLSMGSVSVVPVRNAYTPIFVGSHYEYNENDINRIFEEVVLKDCERED